MGRDLAAQFPSARACFDRANSSLGYDLAALCFAGPEAELTKTEHAQPGIYLVGWVAFQLLIERAPGLRYDAVAGLSLGEFTALAAAGALEFADGLNLVRARGRFMQEACEATQGAMAAVIGLEEPSTREICAQAGVQLANLNCPGQLVISGEADRVARAAELARAAGAKRVLPLPVAGAYHSPLMQQAAPRLQAELDRVELRRPEVAVLANVTGEPHGDPDAIRRRLVEQVTAPVLWERGIRRLLSEGFTRFIELGPGKALSGFMKRIDRQAEVMNVGDSVSLEETVRALGGTA
jgi:[acyl-carrier-protein] S-malonyltransferase